MASVRRFLLLLCLVLFAGSPAFPAISAATVWEVRASGAADTAGGGFVAGSGGTDFSQQNAAQVAVGGGVVTSSITTTVVTFTGGTYTVLAGDIGNIVQFISGTNVTAGFYQITAVSAGLNGTWTLDRTPLSSGTTTNAVANMGGALLTLSKLSGAMIASNKAYCTGAFTSNATTTFAQTISPTAANPPTRLIGYGATRGDATHATLTLTTNTGLTGINGSGAQSIWVEQVDVDCGSLGTSTGIAVSGRSRIAHCKVSNFTTLGINMQSTNGQCVQCEVTGGGAAATAALQTGNSQLALYNHIHDNACIGIKGGGNFSLWAWNLVVNNSGASSDGMQVTTAQAWVVNNTVHNNGRHGINIAVDSQAPFLVINNLLTSNGGFGFVADSTTALPAQESFDGNAYWNNTSGTRSNADSVAGIYAVSPYTNVHDVTLSVSPYVGGTTGSTANFALNNTATGGAACRAAGSPGTWPGNTGTTGFLDMGAVQTRGSNTSPSAGGSPGIITAQ